MAYRIRRRMAFLVSLVILTLTLNVSAAYATSVGIEKDESGNVTSVTIDGTKYTDMDAARAALAKTGLSSANIESILSGNTGSGSSQSVYYGNSTNIDDYTYMTRSQAQARLNKYKNNEVFWGEEYIYYEGDPLADFDNRVHGTYHTYSSYNDATHQGLSVSYTINSQYSGTHLYSVVVESWDSKMTESQYNSARSTLKSIGQSYNSGSDYDKMRNVAEHFATSIAYDTTKTYGDIYHAVHDGTGVCAAYAECFQLCMEELGLESYIYTTSTHALNVVQLDGQYYFVDVTNMADASGVRWQFFLFGTNLRENHTTIPISSTSYDGYAGNYGISNIENSERVENSDIHVEVGEVAANAPAVVNEEPAVTQTEEETTEEAAAEEESTTQEQTTVSTLPAEQTVYVTDEDTDEGSSVGSVVAVVVVCVVLIAATVVVTLKVNHRFDKDNHEEKHDENGEE